MSNFEPAFLIAYIVLVGFFYWFLTKVFLRMVEETKGQFSGEPLPGMVRWILFFASLLCPAVLGFMLGAIVGFFKWL